MSLPEAPFPAPPTESGLVGLRYLEIGGTPSTTNGIRTPAATLTGISKVVTANRDGRQRAKSLGSADTANADGQGKPERTRDIREMDSRSAIGHWLRRLVETATESAATLMEPATASRHARQPSMENALLKPSWSKSAFDTCTPPQNDPSTRRTLVRVIGRRVLPIAAGVVAVGALGLALASSRNNSTRSSLAESAMSGPTGSTPPDARSPLLRPRTCTDGLFASSVAPGTANVECATLSVPEDRANPDGRQVNLRVVVARSVDAARRSDPIIYLAGGPGDSAIDAFESLASGVGNRDLVLFDQRGTGGSTPALNCPEVEEAIWANLDRTDDVLAEGSRLSTSAGACFERLSKHAELSAYNSTESARDIEDLRRALGTPKVNLLAVSYGTAVALEALRLHPSGIRSVVLDSVVPPWEDGDPTRAAERLDEALSRLVDACAANPYCAAAHPDLKTAIESMKLRFDATPHRIVFVDSRGTQRTATLTGSDIIRGVIQALYDPSLIPLLPTFIEQLADGNAGVLDAIGPALLGTAADAAEGLNTNVLCQERGATLGDAEFAAVVAAHPSVGAIVSNDFCARWPTVPVGTEFRAVRPTEVPTLALAGEFDPTTPSAGTRRVVTELGPRASFVEFPGLSHGLIGAGACPRSIAQAFFDAPDAAPDLTCVDRLPDPAWVI